MATGLAALASIISTAETLRSVADWIRIPEAEPARRAIARAHERYGARFPDLGRMLETGLSRSEVRQALKNLAKSGDSDPQQLVVTLVSRCDFFLPTDADVRAAHEAVAFFLECCNEEMLASEVHGAALHDSREQRRTDRIIEHVDDAVEEIVLRIRQPPDEALRDLIAESERANPGLSFSARTTATGTTFEVSARDGAASVHVGTLSFPPTESGRRGYEKIRRLVEEGRTAELDSEEGLWTPSFTIHGRPVLSASRIVISSSTASRVVPVRVEAQSGAVLVDYAKLRLVRAGTQEQELSLSGGRLAGTAAFVMRASGIPTLSFEISAALASAADALRTIEFFLHLVTGGRTRVIALETGAVLFEFTGHEDSAWRERLTNSRALLQDLVLINERLGEGFTYPETVDAESAFNVHVLAEGIRRGRVSQVLTSTSTATIERRSLQAIVEQRHDTGIQVAFTPSAHPFAVFGRTIEVPCRVVLADPVRADFERAAEESADSNPDDLVEVRVTWARITYEFPAWADGSEQVSRNLTDA